jgi:protein-ribulosamine 3-kinase
MAPIFSPIFSIPAFYPQGAVFRPPECSIYTLHAVVWSLPGKTRQKGRKLTLTNAMQPEILAFIQQIVPGTTGSGSAGPLQFFPVGDGSINSTYQIQAKVAGQPAAGKRQATKGNWQAATDNRQAATGSRQPVSATRQWFCKINDAAPFPGLFAKERDGLAILGAQHIIRVPAVVACETIATTDGTKQVLILEWIEPSVRTEGFWRLFGEQLARLHQVSWDSFGLDDDNYMGALPQCNHPSQGWVDFFIQQRLAPQIRLAAKKGLLGNDAIRQFERLYKALPGIFPDTAPSLLHGDLWSGNFLCDREGQPVLIDPAVYFGHPGMDLAMTTLFGGFERGFYESYAYYSPFPANYREQWDICNLYPLLIHLNLFGKSYLGAILDTIQPF